MFIQPRRYVGDVGRVGGKGGAKDAGDARDLEDLGGEDCPTLARFA